MPWWEYESDKYRVPDLPDPATERAGIAFQIWILSVLLLMASVVAFVFTAFHVALWLIGASLVMTALGFIVRPKDKPKARA